MSPFELLDKMLEKVHEYPHKARHYNRTLLKSIRLYKKKYNRAIKNGLKNNDAELCAKKKSKYEKKLLEALGSKAEASKNMIELTSSILGELEREVRENNINIVLEPPGVHNVPNTVKVGGHTWGVYCKCRQAAHGDMICCDSLRCKTKWFHFKCVWLVSAPKGNWYCPECKKDWRLSRVE